MRVGTIITTNYLKKAEACLTSLPRCGTEAFVITYGFHATPQLMDKYPGLQWYYKPPNDPGDCSGVVQYGGWLDSDGVFSDPNELIVIADADACFQREINASEIEMFNSIDMNKVGLGYNAGPEDTLALEIRRVYFRDQPIPWDVIDVLYPGMKECKCYNCGLIVARVAFWRCLQQEFRRHWAGFAQFVGPHPAKCQTLTCWLIQRVLKAEVVELPYSIHMQGHYPLPAGGQVTLATREIAAQALYRGELVWFAHHFPVLLGWGN